MEKLFGIEKLTNGRGDSHFVVIMEPAIEDISIGSVIIIPYAEGFKDPIIVKLLCDEKGKPIRANSKFGIVLEYIYE